MVDPTLGLEMEPMEKVDAWVNDVSSAAIERSSAYLTLARRAREKYETERDLVYMDKAILLLQRAVSENDGQSEVHQHRILNHLISYLQKRSEHLGERSDLDEAIEIARRAVEATADDPVLHLVDRLGFCLVTRFKQFSVDSDLEEAIKVSRRALKSIGSAPKDDRGLDELKCNMGSCLSLRFQRFGRIDDLEEGIRILKQALDSTPAENGETLALRSQSLSGMFVNRFMRLNTADDLEEAIRLSRRAIDLTAGDDSQLPWRLCGLASALDSSFQRFGRLNDLEEAINVCRRSVESAAKHPEDLALSLHILGSGLSQRFRRHWNFDDLEEAIRVHRKSVKLTPEGNNNLPFRLNILGGNLKERYKHLRRPEDIEEAIQVSRRALELLFNDHAGYRHKALSDLGSMLMYRFEQSHELDDLHEAIQMAQAAVDCVPKDDPNLPSCLNDLAYIYERRFRTLSDKTDSEAARDLFKLALDCKDGAPFPRIHAAISGIRVLKEQRSWSQALEVARQALDLLPTISSRGLPLQDQLDMVSRIAGLASDACAFRLMCKDDVHIDAEEALELLERGRGRVLGLLIDDRVDLLRLEVEASQQAEQFKNLRSALVKPKLSPGKLLKDYEACIEKIRGIPGYEDFLRAPSIDKMKEAASEGAIVIVNVSDVRSDAILVTQSSIDSLPLPRLRSVKLKSWLSKVDTYSGLSYNKKVHGEKNRIYCQFLEWLWTYCVEPILVKLNIAAALPEGFLKPRIWWIGAGQANTIPFHAAGNFSTTPESNVWARAVSSYAPTMRTLLHSRKRALTGLEAVHHQHKLLLATMETTPDKVPLPKVSAEADKVRAVIGNALPLTFRSQLDAQTVLDLMRENDIFHFAGHGSTDAKHPIHSHLIFQTAERVQDLLTIDRLFNVDIQPALLAFLSACSTAENRSSQLKDEVIHLASGFLVAGFSNVIASMWPSLDKVCVEVAEVFYRELNISSRKQVSNADIARALHAAVGQVRSHLWEEPLLWAQYVHVGA